MPPSFLDRGQGPELPLPLLSLALPCLVPSAAGTTVVLFACLYAPGDGEEPSSSFSPACATAHPQDAALPTARFSPPDSPRRFISAGSNGIPFWGVMGNEVLQATGGGGVGTADFIYVITVTVLLLY